MTLGVSSSSTRGSPVTTLFFRRKTEVDEEDRVRSESRPVAPGLGPLELDPCEVSGP